MGDTVTITLLGTGSPLPDPLRAGPATLVASDTTRLLVDAGRGVVMRLAAAGVVPIMLDGILLTHLHSDHINALNDVITTFWIMSPTSRELLIYGPVGTKDVVDGIHAMLHEDYGYRMGHHDDLNEGPALRVVEVEPGDTFAVGTAQVLVGGTDHRPVEPTVGFRITDGGVSVVVAGDGVPCDSLDALVAGADAYVQTVVRDDLVRLVPVPRFQDILDYHSTVAQAADTAQRAGVRTLVLTHYVPSPAPGSYDEWRALASAFTGDIVLGDDLTAVTMTAVK